MLTGYFLKKYPFPHTVLLVLWLNLPWIALLLLTPYSEWFWYPFWWLNLQTVWLGYCCFDDGLSFLVHQVLSIELFFILTTAWLCGYAERDTMETNTTMRARYNLIEASLQNTLQTPMWMGFNETDAKVYFRLWCDAWVMSEGDNGQRQTKFRRLAKLHSLPMSFAPMFRRRFMFCCIMACVAVVCKIVWSVYEWYTVNTHLDELNAMLLSMSKK